jgi:chromosome segregation ATPase
MNGDKALGAAVNDDIDSLLRHYEKLLAFVNDISSRFAALNFKAYEMREEIRNLEMRLSGTEAFRRGLEWENEQLRSEIMFLRKVLLEYGDPPESLRELVAAYRNQMTAIGEVPESEKK